MSDRSTIEWTDATWNPVTGCTEVSPGCDHCYAKTFAERWRGIPGHHFENGFDLQLRPDKLDQPLRWKRPRRVFVNSMSDLFHEGVPDDYLAEVFAVMARTPQHTYQVLTKRHGRMRSVMRSTALMRGVREIVMGTQPVPQPVPNWPLPNVWLGVSAEDQKWADIRIPALLQTPAAVRFVSAEPLLAPLSISKWTPDVDLDGVPVCQAHGKWLSDNHGCTALDWVIVGGESGRGARPMDIDWARTLRDQCLAGGVDFFYKQQGTHGGTPKHERTLDGRTWDEFPGSAA